MEKRRIGLVTSLPIGVSCYEILRDRRLRGLGRSRQIELMPTEGGLMTWLRIYGPTTRVERMRLKIAIAG